VNDVVSLERELDAIWIGTWKLQVNIPKYQRVEVPRVQRKEGPRLGWSPRKRVTQPRAVWNRDRTEQKSFVQVVSGEVAQSGTGGNVGGAHGEVVTKLTVALELPSWLDGSYVGSLKEVPCMQSLKESFVLGGFTHVSIRYLGESYVLLSCAEGEGLSKIITDNKAWFDDLFLTVIPWEDSFAMKDRLVWVRCRGIPLQMWCNQCFFSVGASVGEVVEIDEATEKKEKLEYARFRVKISLNSEVSVVKVFRINGVLCTVSLEEEACFPDISFKNLCGKWDGGGSEVDTEASSEEGSVGASLCDSAESEFEVAGGGKVGGVGGRGKVKGDGDVGNEGLVQGRRESLLLGRMSKQDEGALSQGDLSGSLMANDSLGFSKVENIISPLSAGACVPYLAKASADWGRRSIGEGSSCFGERRIRNKEEDLIGCYSKKGGLGSNVEGNISNELASCGPRKVLEGINNGGVENCNVSGKGVGWEFNEVLCPQQELNKEVGGKELVVCKDADFEANSEGFLLEQMGNKRWVGDSLRPGIALDVSEQAGVRGDEEGEDVISILERNVEIHGLVSSGPLDGNKMEEAEESRRFEELGGDKVGK